MPAAYHDGDDSAQPPVGPGLRALVLITIAAFVLQNLLGFRTHDGVTGLFALSAHGVFVQLRVWQLVTYIFLHGGFMHILFNMVVLFSFGREMESLLGTRRFVLLFLAAGLAGGLGWLALSGNGFVQCVGASGAVLGVMATSAAIQPERRLTFMIFPLPIPLTMKAGTMVIAFGAVSVVFLLIGTGNVAHAAHLAGGLAGYLYGRHIRARVVIGLDTPPAMPIAPWARGGGGRFWERWLPGAPDGAPDPAEVDRILAKIKERGIDSLTRRERDVLTRASSSN